jgi:hypothetical protein
VQYVDTRAFDSVAENITAARPAGLAASLKVNPFVAAELATANPADPGKSHSARGPRHPDPCCA